MAKLRVDKIASVGVSTETTGSVFFDDNGDYLAIPIGTDFDLGTADFTIELWWYKADSGNQYAWTLGDSKLSTGLELYVGTSGTETKIYTNNGPQLTAATNPSANEWHHYAVVRENGTLKLYIDGVQDPSTYDASSNDFGGAGGFLYIGVEYYNSGFNYDGLKYISNFRVCKGHAVYKSNFTVPTRELDVHQGPDDDRTVLLCCYDGENIFADKTGRHNHEIAAYGDRVSSPTPTATDSPIGITTFQPGLDRDVDNTFGPTFQGGAGYNSQNWLTLPKGTTTERMPVFGGVQVGTRGVFAGAYTPTRDNKIEYITIPTTGNTTNFGTLNNANGGMAGFSDNTRGWAVGGNIAPTRTNIMEYVTISSTGNAIDGGDLITATQARPGSCSNSIRGIVAGGATPGQVKTIVHHTIQTTGIVQDFGDLTEAKQGVAGVMSPTRGIFAGGRTPSAVDTIEYITTATLGNAVLFGELSLDDRGNMGGASNTVRGLFGGGRTPSDLNHIEFITMATLGNAQDFGDLVQSGMDGDVGAVSSSTRVVFGGGSSDELGYVEIATLGNTTAFGNFTVSTTANQDPACFSNGHGGLG